jgi:hypothetical protein
MIKDGKHAVPMFVFSSSLNFWEREFSENRTGQDMPGQEMGKKDKKDIFCNRIGRTKRNRIYCP